MSSILFMENKIELNTMSQAALIDFIEQLWKKVELLEGEIQLLKLENQALKSENQQLRLDNQRLKVENQELKDAIARSKKYRPSQK